VLLRPSASQARFIIYTGPRTTASAR
jgi:hypothetical protein